MAMSILQSAISAWSRNEEQAMQYVSYILLIWGGSVLVALQQQTAPYGRYSRTGWGFRLPSKPAWIIQELPSFLVPLILWTYTGCPKSGNTINRLSLGLFLLHYFQRTFIFPLLIRGGKPTPLVPFCLAISFCTLNGYLQGGHLLRYNSLEWTPNTYIRIITGTAMFLSGMAINLHSDHILRNLRKPGDTGYKIPHGGMFNFVSGANFFGEVLEWFGFAVLNWSWPTLAFAVFTLCNIGPRACQHHRWYKEKFDNYPKNRKALIPFIL